MAGRWGAGCAVTLVVLVGGCAGTSDDGSDAAPTPESQPEVSSDPPTAPDVSRAPSPSPSPSTPPTSGTPSPPNTPAPPADARPDWLGTRVLPERADGLGEVRPTPPELVDRRFPPPDGRPVADEFSAAIGPIPENVLVRSTWDSDCPVGTDDLRYITMTFWGFDDHTYIGEMIVNQSVADEIVGVFEQLYEARFPIEEMRVVDAPELDAPPTGDGNNTTAFVCRPTTLSDSWSEHAYGMAVDLNPFHNPYQRGDAVLPELAGAYLDRERDLPGMITQGDIVTEAFAAIGWGWGGEWSTLKDWMHFSAAGR
ncbi:MAG TPA: M15 family metallopeptidase [Jiangellaceae bacterium]